MIHPGKPEKGGTMENQIRFKDFPEEIKLTQAQIVDLIWIKFKTFATSHVKGVYDKADPTGFEKVDATIGIQYGWKGDEPDNPISEDDVGYALPENVEIKMRDVTWGIDFKIKNSLGEFSGYWSRPMGTSKGHWCRMTPGFMEVLKRVFLEGEKPFEGEVEDFGKEEDHLHPHE